MQRMQIFLLLITIPMAVLWINAQFILERIIPDPEVAALAGRYLRIIVFGAPGVSALERGKLTAFLLIVERSMHFSKVANDSSRYHSLFPSPDNQVKTNHNRRKGSFQHRLTVCC